MGNNWGEPYSCLSPLPEEIIQAAVQREELKQLKFMHRVPDKRENTQDLQSVQLKCLMDCWLDRAHEETTWDQEKKCPKGWEEIVSSAHKQLIVLY